MIAARALVCARGARCARVAAGPGLTRRARARAPARCVRLIPPELASRPCRRLPPEEVDGASDCNHVSKPIATRWHRPRHVADRGPGPGARAESVNVVVEDVAASAKKQELLTDRHQRPEVPPGRDVALRRDHRPLRRGVAQLEREDIIVVVVAVAAAEHVGPTVQDCLAWASPPEYRGRRWFWQRHPRQRRDIEEMR